MTKGLQMPENELQEIYRRITLTIHRCVVRCKCVTYKMEDFRVKAGKS